MGRCVCFGAAFSLKQGNEVASTRRTIHHASGLSESGLLPPSYHPSKSSSLFTTPPQRVSNIIVSLTIPREMYRYGPGPKAVLY
jgi:hypothetical protein